MTAKFSPKQPATAPLNLNKSRQRKGLTVGFSLAKNSTLVLYLVTPLRTLLKAWFTKQPFGRGQN
ncbi:MAG TPA: hypothetical protein DCL61_27465 [Cyanobacteria bacterium UBA12227]|nr:hypothetical protein [Cyanobacteria bacterium UBA12227]HAX88355.1 hypothetical protein [Cyanobacteria bacterium UBA11370]HBY77866.1 hypothetical protein [Cyanobacteria bacterium UBA11148]